MPWVRHDVAIYATSARSAGLYDRTHGRAGGAERQMTLLARALSERGHRVAHIVHAPEDPVALSYPLTLVARSARAGGGPFVAGVIEALRIWRALRAADARVVVVRTASPALAIAAGFCRLHRRALIFSSSNISDFTLERMSSRLNRGLYRLGVRLAQAVVVQSDDQIALARQAFPSLGRLLQIPSFAEAAPPASLRDGHQPDAFLWFARLVDYKQPMRYVELARALPEARFLMIPDPHEAGARELHALRTAADQVANLELLEPLPHDQLSRLIARAAAVVNTSTSEGMPNAFLEAWAHGVPVLTLQFDPDGVVARNRLGVAADGSWDRFVDGARELWKARDRREELTSRVRGYVEQAHSIEAVAARWSDLIHEVVMRR
jgi:glycosyltransferase involved in cell wall biosynthesis